MEAVKQDIKQDMNENDVIKQFMELLGQQNMREPSQDFGEIFQYVAGMQLQLSVMVDELQGVRRQLAQLQEQQPKSVTESLMDKVSHLQEKITNLSERLSATKDHLVEIAGQAVNAFKERGKAEMCKVLQKGIAGVKSVLATCREQMVDVMTDYEKTANQIDSIGDELKQIGNSVSNVGRLLAGKGTKDVSDEKPGVALTRGINMPVKSTVVVLRKNIDTIDKAFEKLERLSDRLDAGREAGNYDVELNLDSREIARSVELPTMQQAEDLINRMELQRTIFDSDERNLIVNYAYKLDDMEKTTALARSIAEQKDNFPVLQEIKDVAEAEIDFLPDGMVGLSEMHEYGYSWEEMLPMEKDRAMELFEENVEVYLLYEDGSEALAPDKEVLQGHGGLFGVEKDDWIAYIEQAEKEQLEERIGKEVPEAAESKIISDFKAKTEELFTGINGQTQEDIELSVYAYLQSKIDEYEIDIELVDVVVSGSRCRGLEKDGSDLDVVVEYKGKETEDDLFNAFNEDDFMVGGIKVDINPITKGKTGTLGEYLPGVEAYLEGVREAREQEPKSIFSVRMYDEERFFENTSGLDGDALCKAYGECDKPFVEMEQYGKQIDIEKFAYIQQSDNLAFSIEFDESRDEIVLSDGENFEHKRLRETVFPEQAEKKVEVTLKVAECGEFHNLGEYYEDIASVDEAIAIFKQIPTDRMNGIPSIGINIHMEGTEHYEDTEIDIVSGRVADLEVLDYTPDITDNPKAIEVIAELIDKLPEIEVRGSLEKWQAASLAAGIDQLSHDYDTSQYNDTVKDREAQVANITEDIRNGNTEYLNDFLNALISESVREGIADIFGKGLAIDDSEGVQTARKARELLDKMAEYKPLAKIEELEECNYNMIDNVLNNEKPKAMQEHRAGRISIKEKLAEKKAVIEQTDRVERESSEKGVEKKTEREI